MNFLFPVRVVTNVAAFAPAVHTPLGRLDLACSVQGLSLPQPPEVYSAPPVVTLFAWATQVARVELVLGPLASHQGAGEKVDGCWTGIWRIRATHAISSIELGCTWQSGARWTDGGPASGQGLEAQTWDDGSTTVTVGAPDAEALQLAAEAELVPRRWWDLLTWGSPEATELATYMRDGLVIRLPALSPGEQCQSHFVVAWATDAKADDDPTWFAVDRTPNDVLRVLEPAV